MLCDDTGPVDPNSTKTKEEFQFKGSIAGIVLSDDSIPVSGVAVALDSAGNSTVTDSLGHYRIPNVTAGTYKISFTHPHYFDTSISKNITLTIDEDVIGIAMVIRRNPSYFPGSISGTIFDQDLAPVKDVLVLLDSIGTTTTSDSAGKFTLSNVVPGIHKLTFSSTNYVDTALASISVALQQKVTSVAIRMRKNPTFFPGKISGSIIGSATKKGITGIIVTRIPDGATTSTDSLGLYTFADVPVGSIPLLLRTATI